MPFFKKVPGAWGDVRSNKAKTDFDFRHEGGVPHDCIMGCGTFWTFNTSERQREITLEQVGQPAILCGMCMEKARKDKSYVEKIKARLKELAR